MRILRGLLIFGLLIFLFFAGGPALGVVVLSSTIMIPILFVAVIVLLAAWKIRELIRR